MAERWEERIVNLQANIVLTVTADYERPMNTLVIKNLSNNIIYAGLKHSLSNADYEVQVQPGDYGLIVRPYDFSQVYLLAGADVQTTVYLVKTDNPMILLPSMAKPVQAAQVAVVATAGLKAADLSLDGSKHLAVNVKNEVDLKGVDAKKVTIAGAGDSVIKATAGKVYAVRAVGANVTLKDDATEKWYVASGDKDEFSQPVACGTNITLTFSGAGSAYIIYS